MLEGRKVMRITIVVGIMLVLALLLSIPSIPAIQLMVTDNELNTRESDLQIELQDFDINKIKELFNRKPLNFTPLFLTLFVNSIFRTRAIRGITLTEISSYWGRTGLEVTNPLLFLRGEWLLLTAFTWLYFWEYVYETLGWDGLIV